MKVPIPREHGAWGMLYVPFIIAAVTVGSLSYKLLLFFIGMTAAFFAHEPLVIYLRLDPKRPENKEKREHARFWFGIYSLIAAASMIPLIVFNHLWLLLVFGGLSGIFLFTHVYLVSELSQRNIVAEFLGVLCLTASAPATCYVARGTIDRQALLLWAINILYFTSSIFYIKMRVSKFAKKKDAPRQTTQCIAYHAFLIVCLVALVYNGASTVVAALAFVPVVIRALYYISKTDKKLSLKSIGFSEVAYSLIFVLFSAIGMKMR